MQKFKNFYHECGVKNRQSLYVPLFAFALALVFCFSLILYTPSNKGSNNLGSAIAQSLNPVSFQDKTKYTLVESTKDFTLKQYTLTDLVDARTLENNDTTQVLNTDLTTKDLIWLPQYASDSTDSEDDIRNMLTNTDAGRKTTATDWVLVNYAYIHQNNTSYSPYYWLRSASSSPNMMRVGYSGNVAYSDPTNIFLSIRPAMQFNLNSIISARSALNIQINTTAKTITVPNIMYPQTRAIASSTLHNNLNNAYNNGTLQSGMKLTGKSYKGYNGDYLEYYYGGSYFVRTPVNRYPSNTLPLVDNSTPSNGSYIWIIVEPIVWSITNWDKMPTSINPNGDGTATEMIVISKKAIVKIGENYNNSTSTGCSLWQNSYARAYLNGYDLAEQNNGTNGSDNAAYLTSVQANFKNNGFAQTVWHNLKPALISTATLNNNGYYYNSDASAWQAITAELPDTTNNLSSLTTRDAVWLPSYEGREISSSNVATYGDPTGINTMIYNITGAATTNASRQAEPSDWVLANYGYVDGSNPAYTPRYWLRSACSVANVYYVNNLGYVNNYNPTGYPFALRPALQFNLQSIISARSALGVTFNAQEKIIVIPNIMYPQTRVPAGSTLETNLETAYNKGNVKNGMVATGVTYRGYAYDQVEYLYDGNYYVRTRTTISTANTLPMSDGSTPASGKDIWIKVEPIEWLITNWADMPAQINPNGTGLASTIEVLSKKTIAQVYTYYPNSTDDYRTMWQNSRIRAYLNGYNLNDQNNFGNGNPNYRATDSTTGDLANLANFKGMGFIDTIWHETEIPLIKQTTLNNTGYYNNSTRLDTNKNNLQTNDYVFLPSYEDRDISSSNVATYGDSTGLNTMMYNLTGATSSYASRRAKATDWTIVNYTYFSSSSEPTPNYWLRSPNNYYSTYYAYYGGNMSATNTYVAYNSLRPALQFNLDSIISARNILNVQVNIGEKTIIIPNIMYPQTRVAQGSELEFKLTYAYNNGNLQNGMRATGINYRGYTYNHPEYYFDGSFYVRTRVTRYTNYTLPLSDNSAPANNTYIWIKVEPIVWLITNWSKMPTSINPNGDGTATEIIALSQKVIAEIGQNYNDSSACSGNWQNSYARAYLNSYKLNDQNRIGNGNVNYMTPTQANFKGNGFLDTVWHDFQEYTLVDILEETSLTNTVYTSETESVTTSATQTSDFAYIPTETELSSMITNIFGADTPQNRIATPTDYALANKANLNMQNQSNYNLTVGSTFYWLRNEVNNNLVNYISYTGNVSSTTTMHSHNASRVAMKFNISSILNQEGRIGYTLDALNKTITFDKIMYPQSKVEKGSRLETNLNNAYNSPTSTNGITSTGKAYAGLTTWDGDTQNTTYNYEYFYKGDYYVRVLVQKYNSNYAFSDGDSSNENGSYIWIKVKPIVWYIANWDSLPSTLTNGETSGSATSLTCLSQYAIVSIGDYYPNTLDAYRTSWQNSVLRAYLNGYDLTEQNSGINGNVTYTCPIKANFKGLGFVDTIWHSYLGNLNWEKIKLTKR